MNFQAGECHFLFKCKNVIEIHEIFYYSRSCSIIFVHCIHNTLWITLNADILRSSDLGIFSQCNSILSGVNPVHPFRRSLHPSTSFSIDFLCSVLGFLIWGIFWPLLLGCEQIVPDVLSGNSRNDLSRAWIVQRMSGRHIPSRYRSKKSAWIVQRMYGRHIPSRYRSKKTEKFSVVKYFKAYIYHKFNVSCMLFKLSTKNSDPIWTIT